MNDTGNAYYQVAYDFFEMQQYGDFVENIIKAYNCGVHQEEILETIYTCFITPNEMEFQKNYEENRKELINIPYEDLEIDFIPVSDTKFYLFSRVSKEFIGSFQMDDTSIMSEEIEFESVLIADCWDFREMLPFLKEKTWETVYILLNEQKTYFASFFKLPCFRELYMNNVIVFESIEILKLFFEEYSDFYLPKQILAMSDRYDLILNQIHKSRIDNLLKKRENVFLSILIPSYNRGKKALSAVNEICDSDYDSEIEIIVSDNGSTLQTQEYHAIQQIHDSRVRYHRNENNMGFLQNVIKVLDMAKGKYAVLSSDDDIMLIEYLPHYLKLFKKYGNYGVFLTGGVGKVGNFRPLLEKNVTLCGIKAVYEGINSNYVTGIGYNMELVRRNNLLEFMRQHADNIMVDFYPHCVVNFKLSLISPMLICAKPPLWLERDTEETSEESLEEIKDYMTIESREKQLTDLIKLFIESGMRGSILCCLYRERCWKFLHLLFLAMYFYPDYYKKQHITWIEFLEDAVKRCQNNLLLLKDYTTFEEREELQKNLDVMYLDFEKKLC